MMTKKYNIFLSWLNDEGIYNEEAIQQDRLVITNYLQNQGYADAQVDLTVTEACNSKDRIIVTFTADKGERYSFGTLSFEGNSLICDEEIDRLFEMRRNEALEMCPQNFKARFLLVIGKLVTTTITMTVPLMTAK